MRVCDQLNDTNFASMQSDLQEKCSLEHKFGCLEKLTMRDQKKKKLQL